MNFWLSALIYNPLEAFILIYFCNIFTNIKANKNIVNHCYVLGFINLLFQYVSMFTNNDVISFVYDIFIALFIMPIISFVYIFIFINRNNSIKISFAACIFNFVTIFIINYIFSKLDIIKYTSFGYDSIYSEILFNTSLKIFQIFVLFGGIKMKNILKKIAYVNTEKAFTAMKSYNPKMPKILKEKLEKSK